MVTEGKLKHEHWWYLAVHSLYFIKPQTSGKQFLAFITLNSQKTLPF